MKTPHMSTVRGKRVHVILRDGSSFVAKFRDRSADGRTLEFYDHPPVRSRTVRALGDYRKQAHDA